MTPAQPLQPGLDGAWLTTVADRFRSTGCVFVCLGLWTLARQGLQMICSGVCAVSYAARSVARGGRITGLPGPVLSAAESFPAGRAYSLAVTPSACEGGHRCPAARPPARAHMTTVGLVVNPSASRDVRRLTSLAPTIDVHTRVNVVARVLCGLATAGVETVLYMAEPCRVVERAGQQLAGLDPGLARRVAGSTRQLGEPGQATDAAGTAAAALALARAGAACVITVGGDGTNRAVVSGWADVVMIPLPGGTNNAFATPIDPTAAGLAAALFSLDPPAHARHVRRLPRLHVVAGDRPADMALVDAVTLRTGWIGAHAVWDPAVLAEAMLTRADPAVTGLAGLGGMLAPFDAHEGRALHIRFRPDSDHPGARPPRARATRGGRRP